MELNCLYVHSTYIGYARLGVKLVQLLREQGVSVYESLDEHPDHTFVERGVTGDPNAIIFPKDPAQKVCNVVCWISTPGHARGWFDSQYKILFTMWEATVLPESFRENLHHFDLIIVPSEHNRELFSRYHPNVQKLWLGVDTNEWKYVPRALPTTRFNFLIGGSGKRKGTDLAYRAFKKVFRTWPKDSPIPYLIMKSPKSEDYYGERIERVGGRISDQSERDLYAMAHCYVQPSRGEGWGLQPLQAMATGMPTILSNGHGHAEFAELGIPISCGRSVSDYFIYGDAGEWWEPNFDELCDAMEDVYSNYEKYLEQAKYTAKVIPQLYSWDLTAQSFVAMVGKDRLSQPYSGKGIWEHPNPTRYLVRVLSPWKADIAGIHHQFLPNNDYYEVADVKRILFEGGVLDPSCIITNNSGPVTELESGLAPSQIATLDDYSASMSWCWTCGQKLGSGTKRLEDS